jgi:hypothetical protein
MLPKGKFGLIMKRVNYLSATSNGHGATSATTESNNSVDGLNTNRIQGSASSIVSVAATTARNNANS